MTKPRIQYIIQITWLSSLILFPFVLWMLPANYFEQGGIEICPSQLIFNFECFGCGMTRAILNFHHLEFADAIYFNYGVVIVYPLLVFIWFLWVKAAIKAIKRYNGTENNTPVAI